jgi:cobalt-zinc-cadmium efflux system membrane fusion protein
MRSILDSPSIAARARRRGAALARGACRMLAGLSMAVLVSGGLGCGERSGAPHEESAADHGHAEAERADAVTEDALAEPDEHPGPVRLDLGGVRGVTFAPVGEPQEEGAWFAAEAVSEPGAAVAVSTPVAGIVVAVLAGPGREVGRGEPVLEIRSPELADLKATWLAARARRRRAEADTERERRLLAAAATSERDAEAAAAAAAVAAAEEEAARLALEGRGIEAAAAGVSLLVRATRAGTVTSLAVTEGQGVEAGQELCRLVAAGARLAQVELPLPGPATWSEGAATEARHADGRRWAAEVVGVPAALSAETRRLTYRLRLVGRELPLAGTPLEVRVPLARGMVLPQGALQQIEGSWGVFVREEEGVVFRPIRKGPEMGGDVLVLEGVRPGEIVATDGAYLLKSLHLKQASGGEEHAH